jgi:carboxylesterase type B
MSIKHWILAALFTGMYFSTTLAADNAPLATTTAGVVRGYIDNGICAFRGIPYGDNTAARRFLPPVSPKPWNGKRDAMAFGTIAQQLNGRHVIFYV